MNEQTFRIPVTEAAWRAGTTVPHMRELLGTTDSWVSLAPLTSTVTRVDPVTPLAVVDRGTL